MTHETGVGWTADQLVAELDRRLHTGRLSISAHRRELKEIRRAEQRGRDLPKLPKHDSAGWLVRADQDSAARKATRGERLGRVIAAGPTDQELQNHLAVLAKLQKDGLIKKRGREAQERAARRAVAKGKPLPKPWRDKVKVGGFWSNFDRMSDNW